MEAEHGEEGRILVTTQFPDFQATGKEDLRHDIQH
jgi:hypothetical protein